MYNDKISKDTRPIVFIKKVSDNYKIIPLLKAKGTLGDIRYFPPTCQE